MIVYSSVILSINLNQSKVATFGGTKALLFDLPTNTTINLLKHESLCYMWYSGVREGILRATLQHSAMPGAVMFTLDSSP